VISKEPSVNSKNNSKPRATKEPRAINRSRTLFLYTDYRSETMISNTDSRSKAMNSNSNVKRIDLKQDLQILVVQIDNRV
jgi:hypothetical protein